NIYSMAGMAWALSSHYFPLAYLVLGPALRALDMRLEAAALLGGGHCGQVFKRVTLPLLRPAILSALLLLFVMGMASYEVPRLIGRPARIDVFTTDIQGAIIAAPPAFGVASALGLTLLAICVLAVVFYRRATRHAESFATITGKGYRPTRVKLGRARRRRHVHPRARRAAGHAGLAVVLPQSGPAVFLRGRAGDVRQLRVHPELSDLSRRVENERAARGDGRDDRRRSHLCHGLDRAAIVAALRLHPRRARLRADRDPGRDRRRRHPGRLSHAADPDLQHDLDPARRLRDLVSPLRHAVRVERVRPDPSRARGGGCGLGRWPCPDLLAHHAAASGAGAAGRLDLRFRPGGARARRVDLPRRSRHPCARNH